jgi:hypothetical protein
MKLFCHLEVSLSRHILTHLNALQQHTIFFADRSVYNMSENVFHLKAAGLSEICILSQVPIFVVIIVIIIITTTTIIIIIIFLNKRK